MILRVLAILGPQPTSRSHRKEVLYGLASLDPGPGLTTLTAQITQGEAQHRALTL